MPDRHDGLALAMDPRIMLFDEPQLSTSRISVGNLSCSTRSHERPRLTQHATLNSGCEAFLGGE